MVDVLPLKTEKARRTIRIEADAGGLRFPEDYNWAPLMERLKKLGLRIDVKRVEWCG